ncbi:Serine/threonine protein phosphatase 2A regulatory subunit B''alpha [Galdieria sulphuraria]|uniref:Protein phosphatase 2 (Formerly 2A), regulatory subunit B n=1 Tax=Galdieria sulphuraria TaxID=130081 RepID=M2VVQ2_GALSU|nr:protein phosphatase 2 (formerly 2A), regulatory subunit B'' [Galdieria sulphuraria]EME27306.1 protein phosphatase 2 (formerly 2A), regulatory subunit B'' [Galdieria sulphuraria]GJD11369.1 Serine/threonine protein phosphatase 2A regulatory subunit B''alpha [Galdieria sulphuraria]|eukprot:XP_005703826.1 protein phosphatase 2 (formerly 2A), regulatory subunit B'' [Galdieria sulphuraria]
MSQISGLKSQNNKEEERDWDMAQKDTYFSVSPSVADVRPYPKLKLDELFFAWLSKAETKALIHRLIDARKNYQVAETEAGNEKVSSGNVPATLETENKTEFAAKSAVPVRREKKTYMETEGEIGSTMIPNSSFPIDISRSETVSPNMSASSQSLGNQTPASPTTRFIMANLTFSPRVALSPRRAALTGNYLPDLSLGSGTPPMSPRRAQLYRRSSAQTMSSKSSSTQLYQRFSNIPRFFFPEGSPEVMEEQLRQRSNLKTFLSRNGGRLGRTEFTEFTTGILGLPSFIGGPVFDRLLKQSVQGSEFPMRDDSHDIMSDSENEVAREFLLEREVISFYDTFCARKSGNSLLFSVLLGISDRNYLIHEDLFPFLEEFLQIHPGLAFLQATPEFQHRYAETVIERIFYSCARWHQFKLFESDLKKGKIFETFLEVDREEDINRERRFFSYEHFYVLYCRFWELDTDHDLLIDKEDMLRYGGHALTYRIVDRIFGGYGRPRDCKEEGFMSYTDFIWFCISEEDKNSDVALDYWFRCIDLDGDGMITLYDMEYFYSEQLHRMECLGHEPIPLEDIVCQLLDMVRPDLFEPIITRSTLRRCKLRSNFFNVLFNLNKFISIENKDPYLIRQEHATPELTDWDRFAAIEYLRLSAEEEAEEESWDDVVAEDRNWLATGEAPF